MATIQNVFDECKKLYAGVYDYIVKMANHAAKVDKDNGIKTDPSVTIAKFELIIQYSLLQFANTSGGISSNEKIFIRDITKSYDFINYFNKNYASDKKELSWETLVDASPTVVQNFLDSNRLLFQDMIYEVRDVFANYDKVTNYNYLADLKATFYKLIQGLALMDGDMDNEDYNKTLLFDELAYEIEKSK